MVTENVSELVLRQELCRLSPGCSALARHAAGGVSRGDRRGPPRICLAPELQCDARNVMNEV